MSSIQTLCPDCGAINRLPAARVQERPNCGKCHLPLFPGKPLDVDDNDFQRWLQKEELPIVVDFWAAWCGPCKAMAPVFAQVAASHATAARFVKVDTEQATQTAARYGIRSIPTLMVFKGGNKLAEQAGALSPAALQQWLKQYI